MRQIVSRNYIYSKLIDISSHVFIVACALSSSACSVSYPLADLLEPSPPAAVKTASAQGTLKPDSIAVDMMPTGSIAPVPNPNLSNGFKPKFISPLATYIPAGDLTAAQRALDLAMVSSTSLESAAWSNPETGSSGAFMAFGKDVVTEEVTCRNFKGLLHASGALADSKLHGTACKDQSGDWRVKSVEKFAETT